MNLNQVTVLAGEFFARFRRLWAIPELSCTDLSALSTVSIVYAFVATAAREFTVEMHLALCDASVDPVWSLDEAHAVDSGKCLLMVMVDA